MGTSEYSGEITPPTNQRAGQLMTVISNACQSNLLLPELNTQRGQTYVYELSVAGRPDVDMKRGYGNTFRDGEYGALQRTMLGDTLIANIEAPDLVALVDKLIPHSLYDAMLIDTNPDLRTSPFGFHRDTQQACFSIVADFANFCLRQDIHPVACMTYDPDTTDRKSGQSIKRAHMHLIGRTKDELNEMNTNRRPLSTLSGEIKKRSFVDESSIVGSILLNDYIQQRPELHFLKPNDIFYRGCPNSTFDITGGWETLYEPGFVRELGYIHTAVNEIYYELLTTCFQGKNGQWERPALAVFDSDKIYVALGKIGWLSPKSRDITTHFLQALKPKVFDLIHLDLLQKQPKSKLTSHIYPLGGVCYGMGIVHDQNNGPYLSIRPQLFSDTGAAGLTFINGTYLKLNRGAHLYDESQMQKKRDFQNSFVSFAHNKFKNKK